jgi:ribosomal protein L29
MKKTYKDLLGKSVVDLQKDVQNLKNEIVKGGMESASNPQKDTNIHAKKRKQLARTMTALNQKKEMELLDSKK